MTDPKPKKPKKSWKTTALGVVGALGLILGGIYAQFDSDPETVANWMQIIPAAAAAFGVGFVARDNNVTSEDAGAR